LRSNDAADLAFVGENQVGFRSAILAEYLVRKVFDPGLVLDVLIQMINKLTDWADSGQFIRDMLRNLMRLAVVGRLFDSDERRDHIVSFYERLRGNPYCRSNPQFWLQFAMARMERAEFQLADALLGMAESKAAGRANYNSFQIENQRAKFYLLSRSETDEFDDYQFAYTKAAQLTIKQMKEARAKVDPYPMRLITAHEQFILRRAPNLDSRTRALAKTVADQFSSRLESWPVGAYEFERKGWRTALDNMRDALLTPTA